MDVAGTFLTATRRLADRDGHDPPHAPAATSGIREIA
jgi:hypothetical protein